MSTFDLETVENSKEYNREVKYKILVYPNITSPIENLERDSYVLVLRHIIQYLNSIRNDLHWTVITPSYVSYGEHVEQKLLYIPGYNNSMRSHFDIRNIKCIINHREIDYDIIYSHLPEHTSQLANYFFNVTHSRPKIIGYSHYYEFPIGKVDQFLQNIIGTLRMEECGVNSEWLKNEVLNFATKYFNEQQIEKLNKIIQPHYLGSDNLISKTEIIPKSILWNHRPKQYTGFNLFVKWMDELYEKRKDFTVYLNYDSEISRSYFKTVKKSRNEYLKFVKTMLVSVAMERENSGWSLATMDCLSGGTPTLMPESQFYPEKTKKDYPFFFHSKNDFLSKIELLLDSNEYRNSYNKELETISINFMWDSTISRWFNGWKVFDPQLFTVLKESKIYEEKIIPFIKKSRVVTKEQILSHFAWGADIPWGYYRNMLRMDNRVKLFVDRYEYVG